MTELDHQQQANRTNGLRDRIAALVYDTVAWRGVNVPVAEEVADALIRELDTALVDFGLWLAEEITGRQMARIDLESCLTDWKADDE